MIRFVECDNCGARYFVSETDKPVLDGRHFLHRVCDTCFMPMEVKNPFLREEKDERWANGDTCRKEE